MSNILMKAFRHPDRIISHMIIRFQCLRVAKVVEDGKLFYKYKGTLYPEHLDGGNARRFIIEKAVSYCKGTGIDVGADQWPLPGAIPIQDEPHMNAYKLDSTEDGSLDFVFSSHCVEHLARWEEALTLWISKLKEGGILFLYLPHESMELWNPGGPWVGYNHKWSPTHEVLLPFLRKQGMEIIEHNSGKDEYWSFHIVCKRTAPGSATTSELSDQIFMKD